MSDKKMTWKSGIKNGIADLIGVSGCCLIVYGIILVNIPAAFVVGGLFLIGGAWMLAK